MFNRRAHSCKLKACLVFVVLVCFSVIAGIAVCFSANWRCLGGNDVYRAAAGAAPPQPPPQFAAPPRVEAPGPEASALLGPPPAGGAAAGPGRP
jgi:hypothetical protein